MAVDTTSSSLPSAGVPVAAELAESQITASTVPAPAPPTPCDPAEIAVQAVGPGVDADQVIDLINQGDEACEVDIASSPDADEDLEPNVVLGPGEVAHLWVSESSPCGDGPPGTTTELDLRVNGVGRSVPLTFAPQCDIELWAFFTD